MTTRRTIGAIRDNVGRAFPVNTMLLASAAGITVYTKTMDERTKGVLTPRLDRYALYLPVDADAIDARFSVAWATAFALLHPDSGTTTIAKRHRSEDLDADENATVVDLALDILMPAEAVMRHPAMRSRDLGTLARFFGVKHSRVTQRLDALSVTDDPAG